MSSQALTIVSGVVLLAVFGLVGLYLRRRRRGLSNGAREDESS